MESRMRRGSLDTRHGLSSQTHDVHRARCRQCVATLDERTRCRHGPNEGDRAWQRVTRGTFGYDGHDHGVTRAGYAPRHDAGHLLRSRSMNTQLRIALSFAMVSFLGLTAC